MKKLMALVTFGAGYVLGTKAGRQRYEQILRMVRKAKEDPHVQQATHQAADFAREQAPLVKDKAQDMAGRVKDKVSPGSESSTRPSTEDSFQPDPYPQRPLG